MKRFTKSLLPLLALACVCVLACATLAGCASSTGSTKAAGVHEVQQKTDSDNVTEYTVEEEISYRSGIHHAELVIEDYDDYPITIEIYSHSAPNTAEKFCRLADRGYYNGKPVFWVLNEMYMRMGNPEQDDDYLITGEYEESDVKNSNSLKRGIIALNRAADGQQSDASSFIIFMSDLSFLDRKYAGFAKITDGYETIEWIAGRTMNGGDLKIDENGRVLDETRYPIIKSITMID